MATVYNQLLNNLDELKLYGFKANIDDYCDLLARGEKTFIDAFYEPSQKEKELRKVRALNIAIRTAGFPYVRSLNDYDFSFQPSLKKEEIEDIFTLRFIERNENIILIGSPGTGKTHLATALGIEAARNHYATRFISCHQLMNELSKANKENRLEYRLKHYLRYKVLIIDELGYLNLDSSAANIFFQLISMRYEKRATIFTSNKAISKWYEIFGEPIITNAILDRVLHHSKVINIVGPSYRLKDIFLEEQNE